MARDGERSGVSTFPSSLRSVLARPRWSVEDARQVVAALHSSGKSVVEFCAEHGLDPQRVYLWRRRLSTGVDRRPSFEEIVVGGSARKVRRRRGVRDLVPVWRHAPGGRVVRCVCACTIARCPGASGSVLSLPPSVRLFVETQPVDGRKGADSLMVLPDLQGTDEILAMVTDLPEVKRFLKGSGEPTEPPARQPARGPPYWQSRELRRTAYDDEHVAERSRSKGTGSNLPPGAEICPGIEARTSEPRCAHRGTTKAASRQRASGPGVLFSCVTRWNARRRRSPTPGYRPRSRRAGQRG